MPGRKEMTAKPEPAAFYIFQEIMFTEMYFVVYCQHLSTRHKITTLTEFIYIVAEKQFSNISTSIFEQALCSRIL